MKFTKASIPQGKSQVLTFQLAMGEYLLGQGSHKNRNWSPDECAESFREWRHVYGQKVLDLKQIARNVLEKYHSFDRDNVSQQTLIDALDEHAHGNVLGFDDMMKNPDLRYPIALLGLACHTDEKTLYCYLKFVIDNL